MESDQNLRARGRALRSPHLLGTVLGMNWKITVREVVDGRACRGQRVFERARRNRLLLLADACFSGFSHFRSQECR
jgi:hypothetical protein